MKTFPVPVKMATAMTLAALLMPSVYPADDTEAEPAWQDVVVIRDSEDGYRLPIEKENTPDKDAQEMKGVSSEEKKPAPDPGWIGDCYYYADGGYYHKDGVYWRPDMKTHYVYEEDCWHMANGGILTGTGVYFPPVTAPDGILGLPWRLLAVTTALIAGPPQDPGDPPEKPPVRIVIEARSSSDR